MALFEMMQPGYTLRRWRNLTTNTILVPSGSIFDDIHVGLCRATTTIIAARLAQGAPLECRIVSITVDAELLMKIKIEFRAFVTRCIPRNIAEFCGLKSAN